MAMVRTHIDEIREKIARVCRQTGRDPALITIIGVTKFAGADKIREAVEAGIRHVGENKVQEAENKFPELAGLSVPVTRHMIGHLQTNKVKAALKIFDMIQSVDSIKLARAIDRDAQQTGKTVDILVQANTAAEEQKFGFPADETLAALEQISALSQLNIRGLMTIGPLDADEKVLRTCFADLRRLQEKAGCALAGHPRVKLEHLSMGMTNDYLWAIEEGSTMVRIGRGIFGD